MQSKVVEVMAEKIVQVVENAGRPVTFLDIARGVQGFHQDFDRPSWSYENEDNGEVVIYWTGMTAKGCKAVRKMVHEGRIALHCSDAVRCQNR